MVPIIDDVFYVLNRDKLGENGCVARFAEKMLCYKKLFVWQMTRLYAIEFKIL